jgi:chitodextrinase
VAQQSGSGHYAKNIAAAAANANTVTVTFNTAARYVDLRASEYSGLDTNNPLDGAASASGTGSSASTPSVTTTFGTDLIFGAGDTSGVFSQAGSGFTKRIITSPDSDIIEDKSAASIGSYNALASQSGSWVMQVVALRGAGTAPDTTPPSVPTSLSATAASQTQVNLSWSASTDNVGVAGYKVSRNGVQVATVTTTTYQDLGLTPGTTYTYSVAAWDAAGNTSGQSTTVNATTPTPDTTPPSTPGGLRTTPVSSTEIDLNWLASTDNVGVTGYKVYRNGVPAGSTTGSLAYKDNGLTPGTGYSYTVSALDAAGNESPQSIAVLATTPAPDTAPPTVPTGLNVTGATTSQLTLNWSASTDNVAVAGYHVFRGGTQVATVTVTTYQDTGLTAGTIYAYTVSAFDAAGNQSAQSTSVNGSTQATSGFPFVASVSANHRYLLDQFGNPFLMVGDSPHSLTANLSESEANTYFADRQAHGINSVWMQVLVDSYAGGRSNGATYDGTLPFTTPGDFSTPNPAYFQRLSDMVNLAAQHGITVFLDPMDTAGWQTEYESNGATKDYNYGVYLGNLFKSAPNIVWITGNDYGMWWNATDDADVTAISKGIRSVDPNHLQTVQLNGTISSSLDDQNWAPLINLNGAYTYYPTYDEVLHAYNQTPTMPTYLQEANYEFENNTGGAATTNETLRRQEYWTITSGGVAGQLYGNSYTWDTESWATEEANLDTPGVTQMQYWANLLESHEWYNLVPDQTHTFLTSGTGTYDSAQDDVLQSDYATAAVTPDGTFGLVYVPTARTITVNLNQMSGPVTMRWFDPSNNTYQSISGSPFAANSGPQQLTTPGTNADGNGDWVLVLEGSTVADNQAPSVPTGVTATGTSGSTATVSWTASTDNVRVTGYHVYRNGSLVGTATAASYQDTGLTPNTTYTYTVSAFDGAGNESAQSPAVNATTQAADAIPPSAPSGLTATPVSASEIDLSWLAATDNVGVTGYNVYRNGSLVGTTTSSVTYQDRGLNAGTTYSYVITALDAAGNQSAQSTGVNATTQAPDTTPPSVPTGLSVTGTTSATVSLSWAASTDNVDVTGYRVYRNGSLVGSAGTTSFTDSGLASGTTYSYTVTAYDAAGNESARSTAVNATTATVVAPTSPTFVQLNSATPQTAQTSVSLAFTKAQGSGDTNIVIIGFDSSSATITSVTDSAGNTYVVAAPLARAGAYSQAIYYAKNIVVAGAGANTLKVTFSASVPYPDIRILEYAGLDRTNPLDSTSSTTGFGATASSGNVTTGAPVELLIGAGTTSGLFTASGTGYTQRVITSPDGDIVEDRVVTTSGTYSATATQSGDEVMQLVAFKAAGQ